MKKIRRAAQFVFAERTYKIIGISGFFLFLLLYLFTLPATYTGGRIGLVSLKFLTLELAIYSVVMAFLLTFLIPFIVFVFRRGQKTRKASASGGLFVSIMTPLLCCSPILPVALSFLGGFIPLLSGTGGVRIQAFIAIHHTELYLGAIVLLLLALYQNAKGVLECPDCAV